MGYITLCLKKGVQVAAMGAALTAGTMWLTGCSTGDDGNETEIGDNGGNGGNTGTETGDDKYYGKPYTKNIGNGFNLYVAMGDNGSIFKGSEKQLVTDTNYYFDKAEDHIKGLTNEFETSLANRPAAQNYFSKLTNGLKSNTCFHLYDIRPGGQELDSQVNRYANQYNYIFTDIIKNLNITEEKYAFNYLYQFLGNEAYHEGLGIAKTNSLSANDYKNQRDYWTQVWQGTGLEAQTNVKLDVNHLQQITGLANNLLQQAANNMGNSITASDLRQVVNMSLTSYALRGTHDNAIKSKQHGCGMATNFFGQIMDNAAEASQTRQAQGREY